jgi:hypothetical protein
MPLPPLVTTNHVDGFGANRADPTRCGRVFALYTKWECGMDEIVPSRTCLITEDELVQFGFFLGGWMSRMKRNGQSYFVRIR